MVVEGTAIGGGSGGVALLVVTTFGTLVVMVTTSGILEVVVTTSGISEIVVTTSGTLVVVMTIVDDKDDGEILSTIGWKGLVVAILLGRRDVVVTFPFSATIRIVNITFGVGTIGLVRVGMTLGLGFEGPGAKRAMPATTTAVRMRTGAMIKSARETICIMWGRARREVKGS